MNTGISPSRTGVIASQRMSKVVSSELEFSGLEIGASIGEALIEGSQELVHRLKLLFVIDILGEDNRGPWDSFCGQKMCSPTGALRVIDSEVQPSRRIIAEVPAISPSSSAGAWKDEGNKDAVGARYGNELAVRIEGHFGTDIGIDGARFGDISRGSHGADFC